MGQQCLSNVGPDLTLLLSFGCRVPFGSWLVGDGTLVLLPNRPCGINGAPAQGSAP
jgi:hypothetical protein